MVEENNSKILKYPETIKNLWIAFAGESQARNKYDYFAKEFKKAGYEQIAAIFEETALNEKEHAKMIWKLLKENEKGLEGFLEAAIEGEHYETNQMYPEFEKIAKEEGYADAEKFFKEVGEVEEKHEARYKKLLEDLKEKKVFKENKEIKWKCRNCGYIHTGKEAPNECPCCKHPQAHFERLCENY